MIEKYKFSSLKRILFFGATLLIQNLAFAQASMESLFKQGNSAYNKAEYQKAISLYEQTLKMGQFSAEVYYNLGNAYYKLNNIAESIYYFEKAKQLDPNDEDIIINSNFAKNMTIDAIEKLPESQIVTFQKKIYGIFNFSYWSYLTVILFWIFSGFFLVYVFIKSASLKQTFFFIAFGILIFFMISFLITYSIEEKEKNTNFAILFSNQKDIWSEPNQQAELLFSLHEGTKVEVLDILENWKKIRIANGSEGWIENASLRYLNNDIFR
tara:strand:- start:40 stop:843 length:804 start_codon:yes stop_codon:yes gene_type:complete